MKDKPVKQPWPRSAKVTVWVLAATLLVLVGFCMKCKTDVDTYRWMLQEQQDGPQNLPTFVMPKAKEAAEVSAPQILKMQRPLLSLGLDPLYGMSPELKKKIFVDGEGACNFFGNPVDFRELPGGERIDVLRNGQMVYNGSLLTKEGADLLEEWFRKRQPKPIRFSSHPCDDSK